MSVAAIIPARYGSTRFPGKPLVDIGGKSMIQRVYEQVAKAEDVDYIAVATDDERIAVVVKDFGGNVIMTSSDHQSGTDRCAEASLKLPKLFNYLINVQGDEPFIDPEQISALVKLIKQPEVSIATLVQKLPDDALSLADNPNKVKVVINRLGMAMYFSRHAIPFRRDGVLIPSNMHLHVGIYAFSHETLQNISRLEPCALELSEQLEQLRWLWNGYVIHTELTSHVSPGIDTPEDLKIALLERGMRTND